MAERSQSDFKAFQNRIKQELLTHRVIVNNEYCKWFEKADLAREEARYFVVQFSVFSNLFLVAQLKKTINAVDLDEMHAAKEILANEIGVIFRPTTRESEISRSKRVADAENEGDPDLVNTEGTVDDGTFKFKAAHFEWLLLIGEKLGLTFQDMGKRSLGSRETLFFCDELERLYGNESFSIGAGASFAVENWAAAGFWKQLIAGFKTFKKTTIQDLPLGFFTWHDKVEGQHATHTQKELEDLYFGPHEFNEDQFIISGKEMLDGVAAFWGGLNTHRLAHTR